MLEFWRNHVYVEVKAAAAAAKSLQLCLILCNPIDGSPPGSPVPGILQARTLECVAISFSNGKSQKLEAIKSKIPWCKWDPKAQILKRGIRCWVDTLNLEHPLCQRDREQKEKSKGGEFWQHRKEMLTKECVIYKRGNFSIISTGIPSQIEQLQLHLLMTPVPYSSAPPLLSISCFFPWCLLAYLSPPFWLPSRLAYFFTSLQRAPPWGSMRMWWDHMAKAERFPISEEKFPQPQPPAASFSHPASGGHTSLNSAG